MTPSTSPHRDQVQYVIPEFFETPYEAIQPSAVGGGQLAARTRAAVAAATRRERRVGVYILSGWSLAEGQVLSDVELEGDKSTCGSCWLGSG
jgi:hypothetical protein